MNGVAVQPRGSLEIAPICRDASSQEPRDHPELRLARRGYRYASERDRDNVVDSPIARKRSSTQGEWKDLRSSW